MNEHQARELLHRLSNIEKQLESISVNLERLSQPAYYYITDDPQQGLCNCNMYREGDYSGGWWCPVHGQRY